MVFYAVANGRQNGIFSNWTECKKSINGYKNAKYKKFNTKEEADRFIQSHDNPSTNNSVTDNNIPDYYVYTDGSCLNNGKINAVAGIGIFFGIDDIRNVSRKIDGKQTNNAAELTAIIETYYIIENDLRNGKRVTIVSDSEYSIKCVYSYGEKCEKNGWTVDIPNKELVKTVYEIYKNEKNIKFIHVMAHTNNTDIHSIGNDHADRLANRMIGI